MTIKREAKRVLEPIHAIKLYVSSYFMLISSMTAINCGFFFHSLICIMTFLTSINYWVKPVYGIKRNLDIAMVMTNFLVHTHTLEYCLSFQNSLEHLNIAIFFYVFAVFNGLYLHNQNRSSWSHFFFHVFVNTALVTLYIGC